ncbi:MAG TPA: Gfo/Idh/MocA family oxidoreductase [Candidatus Dormibacteraeota bacterium]|nr:Gfo/Idh/MocA family oxidoreductase [Candidatus Dormibacteraeota bacterium]
MNGVTGRMGGNQHLARSIAAIRAEGGIKLADGSSIWPDPILVGRNVEKLGKLAAMHGIERWSTDLAACLSNRDDTIYFDAQTTELRAPAVLAAIEAGKHVYCEKPVATNLAEALELVRKANVAGIRHGVVQDKLFLPGLLKLRGLIDTGFFGRILSVRGEFGYWVFEGTDQPAQRPAWNYRKEDGGGIVLDMYCHWRYVLDNLFGGVRSVLCLGATHIPERVDESGHSYRATADDAAYGIMELDGGVIAQINSSWTVRVRRDDLLVLQVDGTDGSAVAGLRDCVVQPREATPRPVWDPDSPQPINFYDGWEPVPDTGPTENAFKTQWELFLKHVVCGDPFPWDLREGAKGVQLAELAMRSWRERRFVDVPSLAL